MIKNFDELAEHVYFILGDRRPEKRAIAEQVLAIWKDCEARDVEPYDYANALIESAFAVMFKTYDLDENIQFSKDVRERANRNIASISEYWPPIDHSKWPKANH